MTSVLPSVAEDEWPSGIRVRLSTLDIVLHKFDPQVVLTNLMHQINSDYNCSDTLQAE